VTAPLASGAERRRILIVDDDADACRLLTTILRSPEREIVDAREPKAALALVRSGSFDLVVSDLHLNAELSGLDLLRSFKEMDPLLEVVLVSGFGSLDTAISAVRDGAFDYLSKPFRNREVRAVVERALKRRARAGRALETVSLPGLPAEGLVGRSSGMLAVYKQIAHASASDVPVLVTGETGTGKELVARAIHRHSARGGNPFVAVNCGALTESLLESELFGHVRGSFTGAVSDKKGLFEQADGGVIFLDEIGETTPAFQVRLLRSLEEGEIRPVGASRVVKVDVRIVAATNRDLERASETGQFRHDLFFRLNVLSIHVPPLRERPQDVELLAAHFLQGTARRVGGLASITPEAVAELSRRSWPGNVRELENTIERLALAARGGVIDVEDIPPGARGEGLPPTAFDHPFDDQPTLDELERRYLRYTLASVSGNRKRAAEILGIDRRTLYRMAERLKIDLEQE
jgi:DNA-binding NtrC family response regulator